MSPSYEYIYVHLPFCDVICHYCDFYTERTKDAEHEKLLNAIGADLERQKNLLAPELKAIYFGGGTPGVTPPHLLGLFLDRLRPHISKSTEITLEANPNNITKEVVAAWKGAGFTRISLGIQSLKDPLLKKLGRTHSAKTALESLAICLDQFENVTGDLIYAVPGQEITDPAEDALNMAKVGVKHLSAYHLTLEPSHFLYQKLPDSDLAFQQIQLLQEAISPLGFEHYEISNFTQKGYASENNQNYWRGGPYLALGPSAHGFDGANRRWQNIADWKSYIARLDAGNSPVEMEETLSQEQRLIEALFTGLRIKEGIHLATFQDRFGLNLQIERKTQLEEFEKSGLGSVTNGHLVLTFRGRMLADEIAKKLL